MSGYWLVRCPNCHQFTYADKSGKWKLCPSCDEIFSLSETPVYLEVNDFSETKELTDAVDAYLKKTGRADLSPEEVTLVRERYLAWLKNRK